MTEFGFKSTDISVEEVESLDVNGNPIINYEYKFDFTGLGLDSTA